MPATLLDGKALAARLRESIADSCAALERDHGVKPGLAVILVGKNPASEVYVANKEKFAKRAGMRSEVIRLPKDVSRGQLFDEIGRLASDDGIHGILVQLPLPDHLDEVEVQRAVPPHKDVDGFHPENAGRLLLGQPGGFVACTPLGVMALLELSGVDLKGAHAVIVGRSNIVGKPNALLLLAEHATVTVCHSRTRDLGAMCRTADILVAAVGRPGLIRSEHIKPGATVIDVGINRISDPELAEDLLAGQPKRLERFRSRGSALVGDVHFGDALQTAGAVTPVPGGVGPLTIAMLLKNTLESARATIES